MNALFLRLSFVCCLLAYLLPGGLQAQCTLAGLDTLAFETFEAGLPAGWLAPRSSHGAQWQIDDGTIGYYPNPGEGQWIYISDEAANNVGIARLETPRYDLSPFDDDVTLTVDLLFQEYADSGYMRVELWADEQWHFLFADSSDFAGTLTLDLSAYAGQPIALRFMFDDEQSWGWGLGLDNLLLTGRQSSCGNGLCDPGESPGLCPEDCPYRRGPAPGWIDLGRDLAGEAVSYRHFKGGTRCDDCSEEVALPFDFLFMGQPFRSLWINANGNLSFGDPYKPYTPEPFCLHGPRLLAPFYADADLSRGGALRYYFDPEGHYLIVTWLAVGYYGCPGDCESTNTFQAILTDGSLTQVGELHLPDGTNLVFSYGDMQWTTGNSSGGVAGLGGSAATVGLNAGDGQLCEGYGRYDRAGYAHIPGSAGSECPAGGISHLDFQSLLFQADLGIQVEPITEEDHASPEPKTDFSLSGEAHPDGNLLSWLLATPGQTTGFRIERSAEGSTYTLLDEIPLSNHSDGQEQRYRFTDHQPLNGPNLYRVQQLGPNGEGLAQATVQVMRGQTLGAKLGPFLLSVRVGPNPLRAQAMVWYELAEAGLVQYRLVDMDGRQLRQGQHQGQHGENIFPFSAQGLPAGMYLFSLQYRGEQQTIWLIKE